MSEDAPAGDELVHHANVQRHGRNSPSGSQPSARRVSAGQAGNQEAVPGPALPESVETAVNAGPQGAGTPAAVVGAGAEVPVALAGAGVGGGTNLNFAGEDRGDWSVGAGVAAASGASAGADAARAPVSSTDARTGAHAEAPHEAADASTFVDAHGAPGTADLSQDFVLGSQSVAEDAASCPATGAASPSRSLPLDASAGGVPTAADAPAAAKRNVVEDFANVTQSSHVVRANQV